MQPFKPKNTVKHHLRFTPLLCSCALLLACGGESKTEMGQGSSVVTGSAGPAGAAGQHQDLAQCDRPVATITLSEDMSGFQTQGANIPQSPLALVRLLMQQSGCFRVVDRSTGLQTMQNEQQLAEQGFIRKHSSLSKGHGIEAQYTLIPSLSFIENRPGDLISNILSSIPQLSSLSGYTSNITVKEAQAALLLTDNQTSEQIAAATGAAKATDLGQAGIGLITGSSGLAADWSNATDGKITIAAFMDAHNKLVHQIRAMQPRSLPPESASPSHARATTKTNVLDEYQE